MTADQIQIITLAFSGIGATVGLYTAWRNFLADRVRLRVTPMVAAIGSSSLRLCVTIVNRSAFEITINSMGFMHRGSKVVEAFNPEFLDPVGLPITLKPRASVAAFVRPGTEQRKGFEAVRSVVVLTACGHRIAGSSKALAWYVHHRPTAAHVSEIADYALDESGYIVSSEHGVPKGFTGTIPK